ncbi:MAG: type VI secretion system tip protein TssI/VgrG [Aliidongia sp.]
MSSNFEIEQSGRLLNVESPLGDNKLILTRFRGTEKLSGLFNFELEMVSPDHDIQPEEILGKGISWSVGKAGDTRRPFHGIVGSLSGGGSFGRGYRWYTVEVMPALWLLTHNENCRVFQQKPVQDILKAVTANFPDVVLDLSGITGDHPPREYCVQYKESDFKFLSRLMEDEGLFYYFKHAQGSHTMVVADSNATFFDCLGHAVTFGVNPDVEAYVTQWAPKRKFRAGKWAQRDYNFKTPTNNLQSSVNTLINVPTFKPFERFDYPGGYTTTSAGDQKTRIRMEAEESGYQSVDAESTAADFATGGRFTIATHEVTPESAKGYFVTDVTHDSTDYSHVTAEGTHEAPNYKNSLSCSSDQNNYRDECTTPRPTIIGLQQAIVTGGSGDEICTDEYGRIKVHFHWDRFGATDDTSSCWVHVVQPWAGAQWGTQFIPRVGMEVAVAFYNGDPDYPVVVGCVYNAQNMPPYSLPDNKTQSGVKSRSSTGGGSDNFNEMRFEDKKGSEQISVQAEKDMVTLVKNDETRKIKHDQTLTVTNNRTITVEQGNVSETIKQGSRTVELNMGSDQLTLDQGSLTIQVSMGSVSITAMQGITLTVGSSSLSITQTGISMSGMNMSTSGTLSTQISGLTTSISGSATTTVSGGIIMIG